MYDDKRANIYVRREVHLQFSTSEVDNCNSNLIPFQIVIVIKKKSSDWDLIIGGTISCQWDQQFRTQRSQFQLPFGIKSKMEVLYVCSKLMWFMTLRYILNNRPYFFFFDFILK
jgi:hypothetical protein